MSNNLHPSPNPPTLTARWRLSLMLAILLLSAAVLIHDLDATSLWADEGWTIAATAARDPLAVITDWVAVDVHPPLFFLELWAWRQVTGDTIFELRTFSVLLTLISVTVVYRAARLIFRSEAVGLLAALFFGLHDLVTVLTQEVRHYPQQQLMTALVLWLYWRFWQRPSRRRGSLFALAGAGLLWSHYWGGFILLGIGLHALLTRWRRLWPYGLAGLGIGLLFVPWLPALYHQITLERPGGLPHALENSWVVYKTLAYQLVGIPELFWLVLAGLGTVGTLWRIPQREWRWTRWHPGSLLLALCVGLTVGLSLAFNEVYPTLSFRSLAVIIPPLAGLVAYGLSLFRPRERMVLVVFLLLQSLLTTSAGPVPRAPWPEVADFLARHSTQDELILLELDTDEHNVAYYLQHQTGNLRWAHTESQREADPDAFGPYLDDLLAGVDSLWVAKLDWPFYDIRPDLQARGFVQTAPDITWPAYIGRPIALWRFERASQLMTDARLAFGEELTLHRASLTAHPDWVTVNLLWSVAQTPDQNYTVSAFLLNENGAILGPAAQHDSWPLDGRTPTVTWQAGQAYFDSHALSTVGLPPGTYRVGLKVYYPVEGNYSNLAILPPTDCADADCTYALIGSVTVD